MGYTARLYIANQWNHSHTLPRVHVNTDSSSFVLMHNIWISAAFPSSALSDVICCNMMHFFNSIRLAYSYILDKKDLHLPFATADMIQKHSVFFYASEREA